MDDIDRGHLSMTKSVMRENLRKSVRTKLRNTVGKLSDSMGQMQSPETHNYVQS